MYPIQRKGAQAGTKIRMRNAFILRTPDKHSAVVLLRDTSAVVHAELETPLTPEQFVNAQYIHAMAPVAADVELGPYDMDRTRFTNCRISVDIPIVSHERMDYAKRRQRKFQ
jgi:hypothetical protein